jgi:hypothetical protein
MFGVCRMRTSSLESIYLHGTNIEDVEPLEHLRNLVEITCHETRVTVEELVGLNSVVQG